MDSSVATNVSYHCYNKRYKAAIALNNAAISLLERGCYKDAAEMFRGAMYLIQLSFCCLGSVDPNDLLPTASTMTTNAVSDDDVSQYLMTAAKCCPNGTDTNHRVSSCASTTTTSSNVSIVAFPTQDDICSIGDAITTASQHGTKTVVSYIVIEPIDFEEMSIDAVYHDSMLILYNFGVAHFALAQQVEAVPSCSAEAATGDFSNYDDTHDTHQQQQQHPSVPVVVRELRQTAYQMFYIIEEYVCRQLIHTTTTTLSHPSLSLSLLLTNNNNNSNSGLLRLSALFSRTMSELAGQLDYTIIRDYYQVAYTAILILIDEQHQSALQRQKEQSSSSSSVLHLAVQAAAA